MVFNHFKILCNYNNFLQRYTPMHCIIVYDFVWFCMVLGCTAVVFFLKILVNHNFCLDRNLKASWKCLAAKCINNTLLKLSRKAFWKLVRNFWREKCAFLRGKYFRRLGPDSLVFRDIGVDIKRVELAILPSIQAQCLPI